MQGGVKKQEEKGGVTLCARKYDSFFERNYQRCPWKRNRQRLFKIVSNNSKKY